MPLKVKVAIADDHLLFAEGLKLLLEKTETVEVLHIAGDGHTLLHLIKSAPVDIVLLDLNMPGLSGFETLRFIQMHNRCLKIIVISTYSDAHIVKKAKDKGAHGYIIKNSSGELLINSIMAVMQGNPSFPAQANVQKDTKMQSDAFQAYGHLTRREQELIELIKDGCTNREMSVRMSLSIYTIETHRKNIMHKLGLKTPAALMRFIMENKL